MQKPPDTAVAASCYIGRDIEDGPIMLGSKKNGGLRPNTAMSANSLSRRVRKLGMEILGKENVSSHDGRHQWATQAAKSGTNPLNLQQAGGWSSLAMVRRYVEDNEIANDGVELG